MESGNDGQGGGGPYQEPADGICVNELGPEQAEEDGGKLRNRGELADQSRFDVDADPGHEKDGDADENDDIPGDHQNSKPTRDDVHNCQANGSAGKQQLVGEGVEIRAQGCFLVGTPGDESVQTIGDGGKGEDQ